MPTACEIHFSVRYWRFGAIVVAEFEQLLAQVWKVVQVQDSILVLLFRSIDDVAVLLSHDDFIVITYKLVAVIVQFQEVAACTIAYNSTCFIKLLLHILIGSHKFFVKDLPTTIARHEINLPTL